MNLLMDLLDILEILIYYPTIDRFSMVLKLTDVIYCYDSKIITEENKNKIRELIDNTDYNKLIPIINEIKKQYINKNS